MDNIQLGFYKINKKYTNYLIGQDLNIVDKLVDPCVYFGPVFEKESAKGQKLKFYVPCCKPSSKDFEYSSKLLEEGLDNYECRTQFAHDRKFRCPLICDSWTVENEYNVALVLKLADMIPVPDDMIEDFDLWNDIKISNNDIEQANKQHKAMYARFKCVQDDILQDPIAAEFIMDTCIKYYGNNVRFDIGDYDPYRIYTPEDASKEEKNLTIGLKGDKAEIACIMFQNENLEVKNNINKGNSDIGDKKSVIAKLTNNKIHEELASIVLNAKEKPAEEKVAPNFYVE